jgi:large subunit ribosomal protein L24
MKSEFSTHWKSSMQPRKQRKYQYNAPLHLRHKFLSAHLSKELRKKHSKRSLPLRKGDEVLVMRGSYKKKKAKVVSVSLNHTFVTLEGLQRTKKDGTKISVKFHPSVLQIVAMHSDDTQRLHSKSSNKESKSNKEKENASKKTSSTK